MNLCEAIRLQDIKCGSFPRSERQVDDFVIVLAFAAGYQSLVDKIVELGQRIP